jgi:Na+/proline symporter
MFATWFGAETCVGAAGEVYTHGIGAVSADPFGYGVCLVLFGLFVAGELRRRNYTTLADLFAERFSRSTEQLVALLLVPGSVLWAAAQIRAFGHVFAAASPGLSPDLGIAIAAAVIIAYTARGGLLADVYTDLLQGIVLVLTLGVLATFVLWAGGLGPVLTRAMTLGEHAGSTTPLATLDGWAIPIAGSLFTQEIISRAVAAKSETVARRSALLGGSVYLAVGTVPVLLGLVARDFLPAIGEPEQVLPLLTRHLLGEVGFVILAGTLVSAILSTVDSALLASGALIVQNLLGSRARALPEASRLRWSRGSVLALGVTAFLLAGLDLSVHDLVQESGALGSAGVFVAGVLGLFTGFGGPRAALASLVSGGVAYVVASRIGSDAAYLTSLACALAGYLLGTLFERRPAAT